MKRIMRVQDDEVDKQLRAILEPCWMCLGCQDNWNECQPIVLYKIRELLHGEVG